MFAKKSVNSRLDYVRQNHKSPSNALLKEVPETVTTELETRQATASKPKRRADKASNESSRESSPDNAPPGCICHRKAKTLVCINCKMFTYGRIAKHCEWHRNVSYLMDFIYCPNCLGPREALRSVNLEYELYQDLGDKLTKKC